MSRKSMLSVVGMVVLLVTLGASMAFATPYTSDRMSFGDVDFGGATVTVVAHWDCVAQFLEGGTYAGRIDEAKKLFNIKDIKLLQVGWGEMGNTALNRYMAGDSKYDLWRLPQAFFWSLATKNAFFPVGNLLPSDYYEKLPRITQMKAEILQIKGQKLTFSCGTDDWSHSPLVVYNKDIFEREGLEDPYYLYADGRWTWDAVTQIAKRLTRDLNNDGTIDQWGLGDIPPNVILGANGANAAKVNPDGKVVWAMEEEAALAALRQLADWRKANVISWAQWENKGFMRGEVAIQVMPTYQISNEVTKVEFNYGILPLPKGPNVDDYQWVLGGSDTFFIPANAAKPLEMVALDNFLFPVEEYEENFDQSRKRMVKDEHSYEVLLSAADKWTSDTMYFYDFLGGRWTATLPFAGTFEAVFSGTSPAAAAAQFKSQAQAILDETLGQ